MKKLYSSSIKIFHTWTSNKKYFEHMLFLLDIKFAEKK